VKTEKDDCLICQAPDPTRFAVNDAIWPARGRVRAVNYRAAGQEAARASGVPSLATCDRKVITRHADHIEDAWRALEPNSAHGWRPGVNPATDFAGVMDSNTRVGMKATALIEHLLDEHGEIMVAMEPKFVLDVAAKLGMRGAESREGSRLKRNQQAIDVAAIFAMSSGHVRPPRDDIEQDVEIHDLRAELDGERKLLAERAAAS
jgi:hypothetical protein